MTSVPPSSLPLSSPPPSLSLPYSSSSLSLPPSSSTKTDLNAHTNARSVSTLTHRAEEATIHIKPLKTKHKINNSNYTPIQVDAASISVSTQAEMSVDASSVPREIASSTSSDQSSNINASAPASSKPTLSLDFFNGSALTGCTWPSFDDLPYPRVVHILRGISGSGRSTLAATLLEQHRQKLKEAMKEDELTTLASIDSCSAASNTFTVPLANGSEVVSGVIVSADKFFTGEDGVYRFDGKFIAQAHAACLSSFIDALTADVHAIVCDNTNSARWEYKNYCKLALAYGYQLRIWEIQCSSIEMLQVFQARNPHHVPFLSVLQMWKRWEKDPQAVSIQPVILTIPTNLHPLLQQPQNAKKDVLTTVSSSTTSNTTSTADSTTTPLANDDSTKARSAPSTATSSAASSSTPSERNSLDSSPSLGPTSAPDGNLSHPPFSDSLHMSPAFVSAEASSNANATAPTTQIGKRGSAPSTPIANRQRHSITHITTVAAVPIKSAVASSSEPAVPLAPQSKKKQKSKNRPPLHAVNPSASPPVSNALLPTPTTPNHPSVVHAKGSATSSPVSGASSIFGFPNVNAPAFRPQVSSSPASMRSLDSLLSPLSYSGISPSNTSVSSSALSSHFASSPSNLYHTQHSTTSALTQTTPPISPLPASNEAAIFATPITSTLSTFSNPFPAAANSSSLFRATSPLIDSSGLGQPSGIWETPRHASPHVSAGINLAKSLSLPVSVTSSPELRPFRTQVSPPNTIDVLNPFPFASATSSPAHGSADDRPALISSVSLDAIVLPSHLPQLRPAHSSWKSSSLALPVRASHHRNLFPDAPINAGASASNVSGAATGTAAAIVPQRPYSLSMDEDRDTNRRRASHAHSGTIGSRRRDSGNPAINLLQGSATISSHPADEGMHKHDGIGYSMHSPFSSSSSSTSSTQASSPSFSALVAADQPFASRSRGSSTASANNDWKEFSLHRDDGLTFDLSHVKGPSLVVDAVQEGSELHSESSLKFALPESDAALDAAMESAELALNDEDALSPDSQIYNALLSD